MFISMRCTAYHMLTLHCPLWIRLLAKMMQIISLLIMSSFLKKAHLNFDMSFNICLDIKATFIICTTDNC